MESVKKGVLLLLLASVSVANAMPNPASENCIKKGGKLALVDGTGYCTLPSGQRCEEWALFRGECPATPAPPPVVGGYAPIAVSDAGVQAAARFAADTLSNGRKKLRAVHHAAAQVVAGMNYRMSIALNDGTRYEVVVFRDLTNHYRLTRTRKL